jgi:TIR domain
VCADSRYPIWSVPLWNVSSTGKHVFISYVREDAGPIDDLCRTLDAAGIPYWRDVKDLWPGDQWKAVIRDAIRSGALVFLACFSQQSPARAKSYQNEELNLAVEEMRQMPPGRAWLIPVRLDDGPVPGWEIRPGLTLADLNRVDLFGTEIPAQSARLATTITRLMGEAGPDAETIAAAVEEATAGQRVDLLRRATKEMLLDPSKRIQLDELVSRELVRVLNVMRDRDKFPLEVPSQNPEDHWAQGARSAEDYAALLEPLLASIQVAARWAEPAARLGPWVDTIQTVASEAEHVASGSTALLPLRRLPVILLVMTASIAALSDRRWDNLKALTMGVTVPNMYDTRPLPLLEALYPWRVVDSEENLARVVALVGVDGLAADQAAAAVTAGSVGRYKAPISKWLHRKLRPIFNDQFPDDALFGQAFDRAETALGVLAQDLAEEVNRLDPDQAGWHRSNWFGRAAYTSSWVSRTPVDDLADEAAAAGNIWAPLTVGLFGADPARAEASIEAYRQAFNSLRLYRG